MNRADRRKRWGVILAGGDGVRLQLLTRFICGDERPKQFCPLYGGTTLLEQARRRAERSIPPAQLLFSLSRAHEEFYLRTLVDCPAQRIVQPCNRGTAPAILSSLLAVAKHDSTASTALFPSDHYYSDETVVTEAVERAFDIVHANPDSVVLVGAEPDGPEVEYGWIEVGAPTAGRQDSFRVRGFFEKPSQHMARFLLDQGSLWNTFVMVGKVLTFVEMICCALPGLLKLFQESPIGRAPNEEIRIADSLYQRIPHADFSRKVLSLETRRLIAHRLGPVIWSDLGDSDRVASALANHSVEPEWVRRWRESKRTPVLGAASAVAC